MLQAVLTLPEQPGQHKGTVAVLRDSRWCLCSYEGGGLVGTELLFQELGAFTRG